MGALCSRSWSKRLAFVNELQEENKQLRQQCADLQAQLLNSNGSDAIALNTLIRYLWPRISARLLDAVGTRIEPALKSAWPKALGTVAVDLGGSTLGTNPPHVLGISVNREFKSASAAAIERSEESLALTARLAWDGRGNSGCQIKLKLAGVGVHVQSVTVSGNVLLELVGVFDRVPFVRGVRMFLLNPPEVMVDFQVQSVISNAVPKAIVKRKIIETVGAEISKFFVLPYSVGVPLVPDVDIFAVGRARPEGLLKFSIFQALDLPSVAGKLYGSTAPASYVEVRCGAECFRSQTQPSSTTPRYEFHVDLLICLASRQHISLEVVNDGGIVGNTELLGRHELSVSEAIAWGKGHTQILKLADEQGHQSNSCTLRVSAEWKPLLEFEGCVALDDATEGLVSLGIYCASGVSRPLNEGTKYWLSVHCKGLTPGRNPDALLTAKVRAKPKTQTFLHGLDASNSTRYDGNEAELRRRIEVLHSYGVPHSQIADSLDICVETVKAVVVKQSDAKPRAAAGAVPQCHTPSDSKLELSWNQAFHFVVRSVCTCKVSIELHGKPPDGESFRVGACQISGNKISEIIQEQHSASSSQERPSVVHAVQLYGSDVSLQLRWCAYQIAFDGRASQGLSSYQSEDETQSATQRQAEGELNVEDRSTSVFHDAGNGLWQMVRSSEWLFGGALSDSTTPPPPTVTMPAVEISAGNEISAGAEHDLDSILLLRMPSSPDSSPSSQVRSEDSRKLRPSRKFPAKSKNAPRSSGGGTSPRASPRPSPIPKE